MDHWIIIVIGIVVGVWLLNRLDRALLRWWNKS